MSNTNPSIFTQAAHTETRAIARVAVHSIVVPSSRMRQLRTGSLTAQPPPLFEVRGLRYSATFSRFDDGRIAEIFLNNHRVNSGADVNARGAAVVASLALQFAALDLICEGDK